MTISVCIARAVYTQTPSVLLQAGWTAQPRALFVRVTEREECVIRPRRPDEAEADGQARNLAHRHGQLRITGDSRQCADAAEQMVAGDHVRRPSGAQGR